MKLHALLLSSLFAFPTLGVHAQTVKSKFSNEKVAKPEAEKSNNTPSEVLGGLTMRDWLGSNNFEPFIFKGTVEGAIDRLMALSAASAPNGPTVGGFSVDSKVIDREVDLKFKRIDALRLINEICKQANCSWSLGSYSIEIKDFEKPNSQSTNPDKEEQNKAEEPTPNPPSD